MSCKTKMSVQIIFALKKARLYVIMSLSLEYRHYNINVSQKAATVQILDAFFLPFLSFWLVITNLLIKNKVTKPYP